MGQHKETLTRKNAKANILSALQQGLSVRQAQQLVGVNLLTLLEWLKRDRVFAQAVSDTVMTVSQELANRKQVIRFIDTNDTTLLNELDSQEITVYKKVSGMLFV